MTQSTITGTVDAECVPETLAASEMCHRNSAVGNTVRTSCHIAISGTIAIANRMFPSVVLWSAWVLVNVGGTSAPAISVSVGYVVICS